MPLWVAYALLLGIVFLFGACVGSFLGVVADRVPRGQSIVRGRSFCPHCRRELSPRELIPIVFLFGACVGSFLGVVADRVPRGQSIVRGRSFCPHCRRELSPRELIPLVSFLWQRRRCRHCGAPIPWRLFFTELAGGLLAVWVLLSQNCMFNSTFWVYLAICFALLAIALTDLASMLIPGGLIAALAVPVLGSLLLPQSPGLPSRLIGLFCVSVPMLLIALAMLIPGGLIAALAVPVLGSLLLPQSPGLPSRLIGLFCVSVPMLLIALAIPGSFGGGDIKLVAVCGFLLGWQRTLLGLFLALLSGGAYGSYLLIKDRRNKSRHFAFGPFLCGGAFLALLYGQDLINWYIGLVTGW